jgi:septum site-determining protein MinD
MDTESLAGQAYKDAVSRFLGEKVEHRFLEPQKKGLFSRLFGGRAA